MRITLSWTTIIGGFLYFSDFNNDLRLAWMVVLLVTITHTFLVYQSQRFEDVYLSFSKNLPYPRWVLFLNFLMMYILLIFPEIIWMAYRFNFLQTLEMLAFSASTALIFKSFIYFNSQTIRQYIKNVFGLFILYFLVIMFGFSWIVPWLNFPLAYFIFFKRYHIYEPVK